MLDEKIKLLIKKSLSRNPNTELDLCLYNPKQTLDALRNNKKIIKWHKYILNDYKPKIKEILLFFPCAALKPWNEGECRSKNYQILYKLLYKLNIRDKVSLHTISEPLGVIGESDYNNMPIYDNPGLFLWFTKKNRLNWDLNAYNECIDRLSLILGNFLIKFEKRFKKAFAFVKPNSNHEKILRKAKKNSMSKIIICPSKSEIGKLKNNYVWMSNDSVQKAFIKILSRIIS